LRQIVALEQVRGVLVAALRFLRRALVRRDRAQALAEPAGREALAGTRGVVGAVARLTGSLRDVVTAGRARAVVLAQARARQVVVGVARLAHLVHDAVAAHRTLAGQRIARTRTRSGTCRVVGAVARLVGGVGDVV